MDSGPEDSTAGAGDAASPAGELAFRVGAFATSDTGDFASGTEDFALASGDFASFAGDFALIAGAFASCDWTLVRGVGGFVGCGDFVFVSRDLALSVDADGDGEYVCDLAGDFGGDAVLGL